MRVSGSWIAATGILLLGWSLHGGIFFLGTTLRDRRGIAFTRAGLLAIQPSQPINQLLLSLKFAKLHCQTLAEPAYTRESQQRERAINL